MQSLANGAVAATTTTATTGHPEIEKLLSLYTTSRPLLTHWSSISGVSRNLKLGFMVDILHMAMGESLFLETRRIAEVLARLSR